MTKKTAEQISYNMSRVRSKDSKIELALRSELWKKGLRYRKNVNTIIGKPDIVIGKYKVAIFCDSEFWHGYDWENRQKDFKSNKEFWIKKIERNIQRDIEVNEALIADGWTVMRFWGKQIKSEPAKCADMVVKAIEDTEILRKTHEAD